MNLASVPFFQALAGSRRVLLAGAGGGFDVYGALPLYFALKEEGKEVFLANPSFTFPERFLAQWFMERGEDTPIFTFELRGVRQLRESHRLLAEMLDQDAIVLVDGGSDSLPRGDEEGLGTPSEDVSNILAAMATEVPVRLLACIGFGVDWYHGVKHSQVIEATAEFSASGGFLGLFSLLKEMPEARLYREACEYAFSRMRGDGSVVSSSILSALEGRFGNYHALERTRKGELWISPLMSAYWCFNLPSVAARLRYPLERLVDTDSIMAVTMAIHKWRRELTGIRKAGGIPI